MLGSSLYAQTPVFKEGDAAAAELDRVAERSSKAKVISGELAERGFHRSGTATSVVGTYNGRPVALYIIDYENEEGITAAQILQVNDGVEYSAMDIYTKPNDEAANFGYEEYYVNNEGTLTRTHSFFSCFFNTIQQRCGSIINVNQIWSKCKKFIPFKLSKFFNCVYTTALSQVAGFFNCLWSNLWSVIWKCLW